jgi:hypothetical protein
MIRSRPVMAHRDILRCRPKSVPMGAKQTLLQSHHAPALWVNGLMTDQL